MSYKIDVKHTKKRREKEQRQVSILGNIWLRHPMNILGKTKGLCLHVNY